MCEVANQTVNNKWHTEEEVSGYALFRYLPATPEVLKHLPLSLQGTFLSDDS